MTDLNSYKALTIKIDNFGSLPKFWQSANDRSQTIIGSKRITNTEVRNPGFIFIPYALHIGFNILLIVADFMTTNLITILCPSVLFSLLRFTNFMVSLP